MKKLYLMIFSLILFACSSKPEKPKLSIGEYSRQTQLIKGVISKVMADPDYKSMHNIAIAVESSRAVSCISVGEECNLYGEILNLIVKNTHEGPLKAEDSVEIYKKINELDKAITAGQTILSNQWKEYINSQVSK